MANKEIDQTNDNSTENQDDLPLIYTAIEASVAIIAIFGNFLVILMFIQDRRLRKVTNFYIISLSLADLLVGFISIPSAILTKIGVPRSSIRLCLLMLSVLVVLCTISIFNLVAVSLDRYWAILYPLDYHKKISEKTAFIIICACWLFGLIIGFLPLFGWNNKHLFNNGCYFIPIMSYDFLMFLYIVTIVLPSLIMAFFYVRIYIVVMQQLSLNKVRQLKLNKLNHGQLAKNDEKISEKNFEQIDKKRRFDFKMQRQLRANSTSATPTNSTNIRNFRKFQSSSSSPYQLSSNVSYNISNENFQTSTKPPSSQCSMNDIIIETSSDHSNRIRINQNDHFDHGLASKQSNHWRTALTTSVKFSSKTKQTHRKWRSLLSMRGSGDSNAVEIGDTKESTSTLSSINTTSGFKMSYSRREVKKAQKLFLIVVFFWICWIPLYTSNMIYAICPDCPRISSKFLDCLIIFSHLNSAGSPFLYAFHMKDFRQALRRLIYYGPINKKKLRELRREELFSVSVKRANLIKDLDEFSQNENSTKTLDTRDSQSLERKTHSTYLFPNDGTALEQSQNF